MSSIFLSHSSRDNAVAEQVKARLSQWGYQVFLDFHETDGIPAGRDWKKELYANLRQCRAVILLCSHASLASRWCFAEITHADALGKRVVPIKIDEAQVDSVLTTTQVIDATAGWEEAYRRLKEGLKDLFEWDHRRPPYPGLPAFQEQDAAIFFGRDKEIREGQALLNRLQQFGGPRLTLMLGASGSGKSSLMRAGLLPRLKRDQRWVVVDPFRPLQAPFDELTLAIGRRFNPPIQVRDRIRWDEHEAKQSADVFLELLKEMRDNAGSREATALVMIDQCEELLTLGANEEGRRFLAFLRALLDREDSHLMILATLRSDFLGSFQDHPAIRGLRVETFPVPQMQVEDFTSVIEGPAKIVGLELGPGLVQAMIKDTKTADALPLLAFTLRELYEGFGEDKLLTLEKYRNQLGRLDGCIAKAAEAVLSAKPLSEKEVSDLRTAFLSMVRVNDRDQYAKQPAQWNDLPASTHEVLERFVIARLLISGSDEKGRTLEVAHEALFRAWPRLVAWLNDDKSFLIWQQRLSAMEKEWEVSQQSADLLLRGLPLREAEEWLKKKPDSFAPDERQFVTASQNWRARQRTVAAIGAGIVIWSIVVTIWLWQKEYTVAQAGLWVQSHFVNIHVSPKMKPISQGGFLQGDLYGRGDPDEGLPRWVTIKSFAIGQYEISFEEYDRFAIATDRRLPGDEGWGRGSRPVINVSRKDVIAYIEWLSEKTEKKFRLPSESEWEFAARAGGQNQIWAGTSDETQLKNYAVFGNNDRTQPVGSKLPNAIGLYDMSGNVWEWVEDCWHKDYAAGPTDGLPWLETNGGNCRQRVFRGGSWGSSTSNLRTSNRDWLDAGNQGNNIGFRLAEDIP